MGVNRAYRFVADAASPCPRYAAISLMGAPAFAANPGLGFPNFQPKAKRIIYLFQSGAPSQMDLFDPKPGLAKFRGQDLPASIRQGQRLVGPLALIAGRACQIG